MRTSVLILGALATACGTAPVTQRPDLRVEVAKAWARADSAASTEGTWWSRLGDASLEALIDELTVIDNAANEEGAAEPDKNEAVDLGRVHEDTLAAEGATEIAQGQLSEDQEPEEEHTNENDDDGEVVENKTQESTTESDEKETE